MNEKLTPNSFEKEEYNLNTGEVDYKNLINRLKEIKMNIDLLEKTIFR